MPGLSDFLNDDTKLETASRFLLDFGQGLTRANAQGLSPFASVAFGFGSGGQGLQSLKKERQAAQDRELQRGLLTAQTSALKADAAREAQKTQAQQSIVDFLQGPQLPPGADPSAVNLPADQVQSLQPPDLTDPQARNQLAGLFAEAGDLASARELATPDDPFIKVGNVLYDRKTLKPVADSRKLPPDVFQQRMELRKAGATKVNVDTAGNSLAKNLGKDRAGQIIETFGAAEDAQESLAANAEALKLLEGGIISGTGADFRVAFGKALKTVGINVGEADNVAATEAFVAARAAEVGRIIKQFGAGTGLSDADREFATKAAAGEISMDEDSIRRILQINQKVSLFALQRYNRIQETVDPKVLTSSGLPVSLDMPEPLDFGVTAPAATEEPGGNIESILEKYR